MQPDTPPAPVVDVAAGAAVDVVMPVYNGEEFVYEAVTSILRQTFTDLRVLCIDDGSTDGTSEILHKLAQTDSRLQVVRQDNKGLVGALNAGLALCTAPLVARMDADDIAMPERFAKQVEYLNDHSDVVAVGTAILEMDSDSDPLAIEQFAPDHTQIDERMLRLKTGMAHPSVMMRREAVQALGGYRVDFEWVEDIDLWLRMAEHGRLANLPDVLLCYRQHTSSGTWSVGQARRTRTVALIEEAYARRGLTVPDELINQCGRIRSGGGPVKWARRASRQGQWNVARKHLGRQWKDSPVSVLTWRMTLEVALRSAMTRLLKGKPDFPVIPRYRDGAA